MKARKPKPPLLTPERLHRLSFKQLRVIQDMLDAEHERRWTVYVLGKRPTGPLTVPEARAEEARLTTADHTLRREIDARQRQQTELWRRRAELDLLIKRLHVEPLIGEFVSIGRVSLSDAQPYRPKEGDVGRLLKVSDRHALIDFGDTLRTWHIPLWSVGERQDPFADDQPDEEARS